MKVSKLEFGIYFCLVHLQFHIPHSVCLSSRQHIHYARLRKKYATIKRDFEEVLGSLVFTYGVEICDTLGDFFMR